MNFFGLDYIRIRFIHSLSYTLKIEKCSGGDFVDENLARVFLSALYKGLLDRKADSEGFDYWLTELVATDDTLSVFKAFVESEEYKNLNSPDFSDGRSDLASLLSNALKGQFFILDVGSLALQDQPHIWYPLSKFLNLKIEGFDPQVKNETVILEPINPVMSIHFSNQSIALGDGSTKTLYINNHLPTSSMYKIREDSPFLHLNSLRTVDSIDLLTVKLDDTHTPERVDLLKLDVQGFELDILKNATQTLKRVATLIVEVEYSEVYVGQPLFAEIDVFLRSQDFELVDLINVAYPYAAPVDFNSADTLIWADAIYRKKTSDVGMLNSQALSLGVIFGKWNISAFLKAQI